MALAPGTRVGVYEVTSLLGAGGMGEVYRARDSRLHRDVALKILPDHFAADAERLARFHREAHVLASLGHANIAHIYGLEEGALVLELIEGPTLADRIAGGPLPISEALEIARQVADALDAAHEHGIVHRDLKPANIKLRQDGTVKVLDFGLAKLGPAGPESSALAGATLSPTLSLAFTGAGVILGTAAYMAPEQARGKAVDKRADIWAFGCVLYEMIAGKRAFDGTDATEMIAAVVRGEADWAALPKLTPPSVERLLKRCLEKDPRKRLRDVGDARFELDHALEPEAVAAPAPTTTPRRSWRRTAAFAAAAVAIAGVTGSAVWWLRPNAERRVVRFTIPMPEEQPFSFTGRHVVAISPNGSHVVYVADSQLFLRPMDQLEATPIRGTAGLANAGGRSPFFSPDGQWIGFWQDQQLKRVAITGGAPVVLASVQNPWGASWSPDGSILVGQGPAGIVRVAGAGGKPEVVVSVGAGESAHGPQLLPDGRSVLFTLRPKDVIPWDQARIVVQSLDTGERKVLIEGGTDARYVTSGHLVYAQQNTVLAVPFDVARLEVAGGPVALVEGVSRANDANTGAAHFAVSSTGTLVYASGIGTGLLHRTFAWVDRNGREEPIKVQPRAFRYPRLSPAGDQVAMDSQDENRDVWVLRLSTGALTRLTLDSAQEQYGIWTPDQKRIIFSSSREGLPNLYRQPADGTGSAERLTRSSNPQFPQAVSADGKWLVYREQVPKNFSDLFRIPLEGERRPEPLVNTPYDEVNAELSPDGRWLAYQSNESGRDEVYVRPFPDVNGGEWQVSADGGTRPLWGRDGDELFYLTSSGSLMRVPVTADGTFSSGAPQKLLDLQSYGLTAEIGRSLDISRDGKRFLLPRIDTGQARENNSLTIVENWVEELKRRLPIR